MIGELLHEEWDDHAAMLTEELLCDKQTALKVFSRLSCAQDAAGSMTKHARSGCLRKLPPGNPGLQAAAIGLNSSFSVTATAATRHEANAKLGVQPVLTTTVVCNLHSHTKGCKASSVEKKNWKEECNIGMGMSTHCLCRHDGRDAATWEENRCQSNKHE